MFEKLIEKAKLYRFLLVITALGLFLCLFFWVNGRAQPQSNVASLVGESSSLANSSSQKEKADAIKEEVTKTETTSELITVDVKGAVKKPGVYQVASQSRIHDVLEKAGGLTEEADSKSINLAQKVTDEAVIYVAKLGEEAADVTASSQMTNTSQTESSKSAAINLNTATEADLQTISGIGQKRAQDIIAYRQANGKFQSVDDLKNVSGIGTKTLEKLKDYVTVD